MFAWLKAWLGRGAAPQSRGEPLRGMRLPIHARYDAATTTEDNRRHWANADGLSPNTANASEIRRILRNRARYETANNSYAKGIVLTLANDCVGTGPRLQMLIADADANRKVEAAFEAWSAAVGLPEKLRTIRMAKAVDGEAFAILTSNPRLNSPVKLDLRLIEADQVTSPGLFMPTTQGVDGIVFDPSGDPITYHVLRQHPGSAGPLWDNDFDRIPAASVLHYFRADRPGQARGIPEITPALPLFAQLRRYTLAVIAAAEAAADVALVIYTDSPPNGETDSLEPMDLIELEKRMATVMPGGWKLGQTHAEQPSTTYAEFKREILNEIARCLNIPYNVAAANSSGYNYASGRLDHQTYFKSIRVEQSAIESVVLDRVFSAWIDEASLVDEFLPAPLRRLGASIDHQWFWDGQEHVDPAKEANAQETRLKNNTTTLAEEYAKRGRDWEAEIRQRAKEVALMKSLGLSVEVPAGTVPAPVPVPGDEPDSSNAESPLWRGSGRGLVPVIGR